MHERAEAEPAANRINENSADDKIPSPLVNVLPGDPLFDGVCVYLVQRKFNFTLNPSRGKQATLPKGPFVSLKQL